MRYLALLLASLCLGCGTVSHPAPSASLSSVPKEAFDIVLSRGRQDFGNLKPGETLKLSAMRYEIRYEMWPSPRLTLDTGVRWMSLDPSIATVDAHGVVTAVHVGMTEIFAICETCPKNIRWADAVQNMGFVLNKEGEQVFGTPAGAPVAMFPIFILPRVPSVLPHEPRVSPPDPGIDPGIYLAPPCPSRPGQEPVCRPKPPKASQLSSGFR